LARIRTIKPEFWTDEKVVAMTPLARLFFIGMLNFVDDDGRAAYSPARLKMQILPADPADSSALLGEIRREGLIVGYEVDGKEFFQIVNFHKHQKVDKRTPSKLPPPPNPAEFPRIVPTEGKGKEGKEDAPPAPFEIVPSKVPSEEAQLYARGKEVLGANAGGLVSKLLKAKKGSVPEARAAIEIASTKFDKREYIGRIIAGQKPDIARHSYHDPNAGIL
jgi:hypothetical protein